MKIGGAVTGTGLWSLPSSLPTCPFQAGVSRGRVGRTGWVEGTGLRLRWWWGEDLGSLGEAEFYISHPQCGFFGDSAGLRLAPGV